jgi:hypothetical protein
MKMGKAGKLFFFKVNVCELGAEFEKKRSTEYEKRELRVLYKGIE